MRDTITLSELRVKLFTIFGLFKDGGTIRVAHRRKIYLFSIAPTTDRVTTPYRRSPTNAMNKVDPNSIDVRPCEDCGDMQQNGVCMNPACTQNRPMSGTGAVGG